jgi:uncharacterized HAD superfamily protein
MIFYEHLKNTKKQIDKTKQNASIVNKTNFRNNSEQTVRRFIFVLPEHYSHLHLMSKS